MAHKGKLFLIAGPSGVGKHTVITKLLENKELNLSLSVSYTSRQKREHEIDGIDYHFISKEQFQQHIANNNLVEYAEFFDNFYGTPKHEVEDKLANGINVLLEIEIKGFFQVIKTYPDIISIFLLPPSFEELKARLLARNSETNEQIQMRLEKAKEELACADQFTYTIINDFVDSVNEQITNLIRKHHETLD